MKRIVLLAVLISAGFAAQSNSIGNVSGGSNITINQTNVDSNNLIYTSNNDAIKDAIKADKTDYPKLSTQEFHALQTLAHESLKIDAVNKSDNEKLKDCKDLGGKLKMAMFGGIELGFFYKNCENFFK